MTALSEGKADADKSKDAKHAVELRTCPRVACSDIKSFTVSLPSVPQKGRACEWLYFGHASLSTPKNLT